MRHFGQREIRGKRIRALDESRRAFRRQTAVAFCVLLAAGAARVAAAADAAYALRAHVYSFSGTRWNIDEAVRATATAGRLLEQCDIVLTAIESKLLDVPQRFHYYFTPVSRELLRMLQP